MNCFLFEPSWNLSIVGLDDWSTGLDVMSDNIYLSKRFIFGREDISVIQYQMLKFLSLFLHQGLSCPIYQFLYLFRKKLCGLLSKPYSAHLTNCTGIHCIGIYCLQLDVSHFLYWSQYPQGCMFEEMHRLHLGQCSHSRFCWHNVLATKRDCSRATCLLGLMIELWGTLVSTPAACPGTSCLDLGWINHSFCSTSSGIRKGMHALSHSLIYFQNSSLIFHLVSPPVSYPHPSCSIERCPHYSPIIRA